MLAKIRLTAAVAALISACANPVATPGSTVAPGPAPTPRSNGPCDAAAVQYAVGRTLDKPLEAELRLRSGARLLRAIRPGQMVTMEYSAERLNVELDAKDRVTQLRCG